MAVQKGNQLTPDFTEEIVGFAIESYLAPINLINSLTDKTPSEPRFSITPFSNKKERYLGADARLDDKIKSFCPFYMQFKRPHAYLEKSRKGIIPERKTLNLAVSPHALYFELRNKTPKQVDFQHNILFRLNRRLKCWHIGNAAYVCPLFLNPSKYRNALYQSTLLALCNKYKNSSTLQSVLIYSTGNHKKIFNLIPTFPQHISIPPHKEVTNSKHRYSFSTGGKDVCFHSPETIDREPQNLSEFLSNIFARFSDGGERITIADAKYKLMELIPKVFDHNTEREQQEPIEDEYIQEPIADLFEFAGIKYPRSENSESPTHLLEIWLNKLRGSNDTLHSGQLYPWLVWGEYLRTRYDIHQYMMVER